MDIILINIYTIGMAFTLIIIFLLPTNNSTNCLSCKININNKWLKTDFNKKIVALLFCILWGGIAALRNSSVGTDTFHYTEIFQRISLTNWSNITQDIEFKKFPLYITYNKIVSLFIKTPNAITFVNSLIFVIGVVLFLYFNSKNFGISLYCFLSLHYYFLALNIMRESLAIMMVMWAFHFAIRNKLLKALIINILAILVHYTAVLGLGVLFVTLFCKKSYNAYLILILCTIVIIFFKQIIIFGVRFFPQYNDYINGNGQFTILDDSSDGRRKYVALFLLLIFVFCWIYPSLNKRNIVKDKKYWIYVTLSIVSVELMILQSNNDVMARLELYFSYFFMLSLPYFIENNIQNNDKYFIYIVLMIVLFVPFLLKLKDYLPYSFFG